MRLRLATLSGLLYGLICVSSGQSSQTNTGLGEHKFDAQNLTTKSTSIQLKATQNGRTITCERSANIEADSGRWYGDCDGDAREANFVTMVNKEGNVRVFGSIQVGSEACLISPDASGEHVIRCLSLSNFDPVGDSPPLRSPSGDEKAVVTRNLPFGYTDLSSGRFVRGKDVGRRLYDDSGSTVDIMVVWTTAAECGVSSLSLPCKLTDVTKFNMMGAIKLVVAQTNTAFAESGISTRLRLVHAYRDPYYVESSITKYKDELERLRSSTDGKMDSVHEKRALYGADIVAMIAGMSPYVCGLAYSGGGRDHMFTITGFDCMAGTYTFSHGVGSLFAARNDRATENKCQEKNTFNFGYRDPSGEFRSIMSQGHAATLCENSSDTYIQHVAQRFSNPTIPYRKKHIGSAVEDNARWINEKSPEIASYMRAMNCRTDAECNDNNPNSSDKCLVSSAICMFTPIPKAPTKAPVKTPVKAPIKSPARIPLRAPTRAPVKPPVRVPAKLPTKAPARLPTKKATLAPATRTPTKSPTIDPTHHPTLAPTRRPTNVPTKAPTSTPTVTPSRTPSSYPTKDPSNAPSQIPTIMPTGLPSAIPSKVPSVPPTTTPSLMPSLAPSTSPSSVPSLTPSMAPSSAPSTNPTDVPSMIPSYTPSEEPSLSPSTLPSPTPSTSPSRVPSMIPTNSPSALPSVKPSSKPSTTPSSIPSTSPSRMPSMIPTNSPSTSPSVKPSSKPSTRPSSTPTTGPSRMPSMIPTTFPSALPSVKPSSKPTTIPSSTPTTGPSKIPSTTPTSLPSVLPSLSPSKAPSESPISLPSHLPSTTPSVRPSESPNTSPSGTPSKDPTRNPTAAPTPIPTKEPTFAPVTRTPTEQPTHRPTNSPTSLAPTPVHTTLTPYLESILVAEVQNAIWTMVNLTQVYTSPVIICSVKYDNSSTLLPAVVRMRNVDHQSFDIRLQNPSDMVLPETREVSCIVLEEGIWHLPDGRSIEAVKYNSNITDRKGSLMGQKRDYIIRDYIAPVVLGQVMSSNDPLWSVFWSRGASRASAPSSTVLYTGKHVGKDRRITRADETIGYIVMETGHASLAGIEMEARRGGKIVMDYVTGSYKYTFQSRFSAPPRVVILSQTGMNGLDGSWALLKTSPSTSSMRLAVDEDQTTVTERSHLIPEMVDYAVFASAGSIELLPYWGEA